MASDPITGVATEEAPTTLDFLGKRSPIFSTGKPALPTGAAPAPSVAPSGPSGLGKPPTPTLAAPDVPSGLTDGFDFASLLGGGDSASEGGGGSSVGGQGTAGLPGLGFGPVGVGPTGGLSARTGNQNLDLAINTIGPQVLGMFNVPTSIPGALARIAPVLAPIASLFGLASIPLTIANIAEFFSSMSPTSVTTLQQALADPNPEQHLTQEQAVAIMMGGALGPTVGGAQPIGRLSDPAFGGFESALTGPQGAQFGTGQGRSTPSAQDIAPDLASLLSSIFGTGRTDTGPTGPAAEGPPGLSPSESASAAAAGVTGGEASGPGAPSAPDGPSGGPGGGTAGSDGPGSSGEE